MNRSYASAGTANPTGRNSTGTRRGRRTSPPCPPPRQSQEEGAPRCQQSANTDRNSRSGRRSPGRALHALGMSDFTIGIGIWDGVEELDFAGPYEVLTAWANQVSD